MRLYIGSYSSGITMFDGERLTGAAPNEAAPAPSFLAVHPGLPVVYAVSEVDGGAVVALATGSDGRLRRLNGAATGGSRPCHVAVSGDGRYVAAANYGDGTVAVFTVEADGSLGDRTALVHHEGSGPDPERQSAAHAHQVTFGPGNTLTAVDLGTDTLYDYRVTGDGTLDEVARTRTPPGCGPRHQVTTDDGYRYVADELTSTVTVYHGYQVIESLSSILAPRGERNYPSEIVLAPDGRHLYVANRGNDSIGTFARTDGRLRLVGEVPTGGTWPRHFAQVGDTLYVANERSHTVTALPLLDGVPATGEIVAEVRTPSCVRPAHG